jgi:hypothetical protein
MVLTVPDIAIIDGPGYRRSYGETTKRASEGSVLSRQRSHEARWGREHSRSESVGLYVADGWVQPMNPMTAHSFYAVVQYRQG